MTIIEAIAELQAMRAAGKVTRIGIEIEIEDRGSGLEAKFAAFGYDEDGYECCAGETMAAAVAKCKEYYGVDTPAPDTIAEISDHVEELTKEGVK
jgi:hypothetical protein